MCTCLVQELGDAAAFGLADNRRCHHSVHRRKAHPRTQELLRPSRKDGWLAQDVAGKVSGSDRRNEQHL